jgi:hypothetical protein
MELKARSSSPLPKEKSRKTTVHLCEVNQIKDLGQEMKIKWQN